MTDKVYFLYDEARHKQIMWPYDPWSQLFLAASPDLRSGVVFQVQMTADERFGLTQVFKEYVPPTLQPGKLLSHNLSYSFAMSFIEDFKGHKGHITVLIPTESDGYAFFALIHKAFTVPEVEHRAVRNFSLYDKIMRLNSKLSNPYGESTLFISADCQVLLSILSSAKIEVKNDPKDSAQRILLPIQGPPALDHVLANGILNLIKERGAA